MANLRDNYELLEPGVPEVGDIFIGGKYSKAFNDCNTLPFFVTEINDDRFMYGRNGAPANSGRFYYGGGGMLIKSTPEGPRLFGDSEFLETLVETESHRDERLH